MKMYYFLYTIVFRLNEMEVFVKNVEFNFPKPYETIETVKSEFLQAGNYRFLATNSREFAEFWKFFPFSGVENVTFDSAAFDGRYKVLQLELQKTVQKCSSDFFSLYTAEAERGCEEMIFQLKLSLISKALIYKHFLKESDKLHIINDQQEYLFHKHLVKAVNKSAYSIYKISHLLNLKKLRTDPK